MRIAFCSCGGSGKTTLLEPLSKKFNIEIHNLTTGKLMSEFNLSNQNDAVAVAGVVPSIGIKFQSKLIEDRTNFVYELADFRDIDFITDRTPLDSLAYYMIHNSYWDSADNTERLINIVKESSKYYDYVFFLPNRIFPLENNGIRGLNECYHDLVQNTIKWLAPKVNYKLIEVPREVKSVDDRVNWIYEYINKEPK